MNKSLLACAITASIALVACNKEEAKPAPEATPAAVKEAAPVSMYETNIQKVSYGLGMNQSRQFIKYQIPVEMDAYVQGMKDGLADKEPAVDQETLSIAMQEFQKEQMEKQAAERSAAELKNKAEAEAFFKENGAKEGVVTTESGLQYKMITKAEGGKQPTKTDSVVVHYRGKLLNGEEFDSSYSRNQPVTFPVGSVIPGWTEGLQLMSVGDKFELYIPSELAYGAAGAGQKIGPHAAITFEVELLDVVDPNDTRKPESMATEAPGSENEINKAKKITSDDMKK